MSVGAIAPGRFIRFLRPGSDVAGEGFSIFFHCACAVEVSDRSSSISGTISPAHSAIQTRDFFFRLSAYGGA